MRKRADRALKLAQMGELSAGRLALDGARLSLRPNLKLSRWTRTFYLFIKRLRSPRDSSLFFRFATVLARGQAPAAAVEGGSDHTVEEGGRRRARDRRRRHPPKVGRQDDGQTGGSECGSRNGPIPTRSHHQGWLRHRGPHPPEFDQSRRAGNDRVNRWSGACDLISRNAMMEGLATVPKRRQVVAVRATCDTGEAHQIPQGEGGELGDPLMPMLFSLGMPSFEGGSGASQTFGANLRFLGRRVRGVSPGEGADGGKHSCRGVVESRSAA